MALLRNYSLPLLLALLLHMAVAALLLRGWSSAPRVADVVKPQVVNASLVVMQERRKPAPVQKPQVPPKVPATAQVQAKPTQVKAQTNKQQTTVDAAKAAAEKKKAQQALAEQRRQQRLAALSEMADTSLEQSLERESVSLLRDAADSAVQSYRATIYEAVLNNWSRPPSARNGMAVRFLVELIPTGELISLTVVESSGNEAFDRSAEQAVRQTRRFQVPSENALFEEHFRRFYFLFQPIDLLR